MAKIVEITERIIRHGNILDIADVQPQIGWSLLLDGEGPYIIENIELRIEAAVVAYSEVTYTVRKKNYAYGPPFDKPPRFTDLIFV